MTIFSYKFYLKQDKYYIDPETGKEFVDTSPDYQGRVKAGSLHEAFAMSIAKAFGKKYDWFSDSWDKTDDDNLTTRGSLTEHCSKANASRVVGKITTAVIARA